MTMPATTLADPNGITGPDSTFGQITGVLGDAFGLWAQYDLAKTNADRVRDASGSGQVELANTAQREQQVGRVPLSAAEAAGTGQTANAASLLTPVNIAIGVAAIAVLALIIKT